MVLSLLSRDKIYRPSEHLLQYTIKKIIGEGRYGICYEVSQGRKSYILKQLKRGMLKRAGEMARNEEEILKSLQHAGIPQFIEKIECENFYGYVLEFKQGRTFEDIIYHNKHVFGREEIYQVGSQIVQILEYLHQKGVVHRDIRVPNTLYNGQKVSLVDFGLARWINNKKYRADIDFAFLGDFLLHLYYSSFNLMDRKKRPWYEELELTEKELVFLKRLMGVYDRYESISELEDEFRQTYAPFS